MVTNEIMSPDEVIAMKMRFRDDLSFLVSQAAVFIGEQLARSEVEPSSAVDETWRDFDDIALKTRIVNISVLTANDLSRACKLPDDEWLPDGVPPRLCAEALDAIQPEYVTFSPVVGDMHG